LTHLLGLDALRGVQPDNAVIGSLEFCPLDEIQPGKNHGSQRGKRQHNGPEAYSKVLLHDWPKQGNTPPENLRCKPMSILWKSGL
jgi:hypothetical protein